jgi:hypothetical protein
LKELQVTARLKIRDGQFEAFKAAAKECLRSVVERDDGTLQYDWFLNEAKTECVVRETYRDSDAVLKSLGILPPSCWRLRRTFRHRSTDIFRACKQWINTALVTIRALRGRARSPWVMEEQDGFGCPAHLAHVGLCGSEELSTMSNKSLRLSRSRVCRT